MPITAPEIFTNESAELELLGQLKEAGAIFPADAVALEIIRAADLHHRGRADGQQIILKLIDRLTSGKTLKQAGQIAFVLAYVLKLPGCRTQNELAARLRISQGRASQLITKIGDFSA